LYTFAKSDKYCTNLQKRVNIVQKKNDTFTTFSSCKHIKLHFLFGFGQRGQVNR